MKGASAKIILVHGTWGRGFHPDRGAQGKAAGYGAVPRWFEPESKFRVALSSRLSGLIQAADVSAFLWSGANSIEERRSAAARLADMLDESVVAAPEARHFIIAHSHGGNVALAARRAMSGNALNVHVVTLATPFLSIYQRAPRIIDRLFAICISIGLALFAGYLWMLLAFSSFGEHGSLVVLSINCLISLVSILFGAGTLFRRAYRAIRRKEPLTGAGSEAPNAARRINNRSLIAAALFFCVGWLLLGFYVAGLLLLFVLPALLLLFFSIPAVGTFLYSSRYETPSVRENIHNLKILRSRRDEASLALFFGKITSFLAHIAGSITILVPIVAVSLAAVVMYFAVDYALSLYHQYQECVSHGQNCFIPGEFALMMLGGALDIGSKAVRFLAFGFGICAAFIVLAAVCKSLFGKELLYRSLNVIVDVYDTPDGWKSYNVDWCIPVKESAFGLRHSLYNNPDAVTRIATYIEHACSVAPDRETPAAAAQPYDGHRNGIARTAAAIAVVAGTYAIAVSVAYAPPGATSTWCALNSYFEPRGLKGEFTVLVAQFENDREGMGDRLAKEVRLQYGVPVIRTCVQVTPNRDDASSAENLLSAYNADLVLWGKVETAGQAELRLRQRQREPDPALPIVLTQAAIPEVVGKRLQGYLFRSIQDSALDISASAPAANLAAYADRIDALVQKTDWSDAPSDDALEEFRRLRNRIGMHAAAGRLMLAAARASHDGSRAKKAIAYFERASSMFDGAGESQNILRNDWEAQYRFALLTDARLNKTEASAKAAASMYAKTYEEARKNRGVASYQLHQYAGAAASAAAELYSITHSQDDGKSSVRLACESLLWLRYWEEDTKKIEERDAPLARQGLQRGILPKMPPAEETDAYKILIRSGKDPSAILASRREMKMEDCERF